MAACGDYDFEDIAHCLEAGVNNCLMNFLKDLLYNAAFAFQAFFDSTVGEPTCYFLRLPARLCGKGAQNLLEALLEMAQWRQVLRVRKQLQRGTLVKLLYLSLIVILQSFIAGGT